jgi:hypothetical protein
MKRGCMGTERMVERMVELMNGVWRGEGFPEDWREGVICPIFKKARKIERKTTEE